MGRYCEDCHCALVFIGIAIFGSGKQGQGEWRVICALLILEPAHLHLVAPDDQFQRIGIEESHGLVATVVVGAGSHLIRRPILVAFVYGVRPQQIA